MECRTQFPVLMQEIMPTDGIRLLIIPGNFPHPALNCGRVLLRVITRINPCTFAFVAIRADLGIGA